MVRVASTLSTAGAGADARDPWTGTFIFLPAVPWLLAKRDWHAHGLSRKAIPAPGPAGFVAATTRRENIVVRGE